MTSYVEQLQILKATNRDILVQEVAQFSVGKCIKKVQYYSHSSGGPLFENYDAYIYYTQPEVPVVTLSGVGTDNYVTLTVNIESPIWLTLLEVGVYYNKTGVFNRFDDRIIFPKVYGNSTITQYGFVGTYYFKPYIKTCMEYTYGNIITITPSIVGIGYDMIGTTLIVY